MRPADDWNIAEAESVYGACLTARGHFEEAEPLLVDSHRALVLVKGERNILTRQAQRRLDELDDALQDRPEG